jgi:hypothetical protein
MWEWISNNFSFVNFLKIYILFLLQHKKKHRETYVTKIVIFISMMIFFLLLLIYFNYFFYCDRMTKEFYSCQIFLSRWPRFLRTFSFISKAIALLYFSVVSRCTHNRHALNLNVRIRCMPTHKHYSER